MAQRKIKNIFPAVREDIADLTTYRALPTRLIEMVDPFLFLNHHGAQTYPPGNQGLPFGPHPHRGFETVTFILDGDIAHRDSGGHESIIGARGVQWMTAGRGLVHSEMSSADFKKTGGPLEILQLWVNLPARLKMTDPRYIGLQGDEIPVFDADQGRVKVQLTSGTWNGHHGPIPTLTDITVMMVELQAGTDFKLAIAASRNIFFYVVRGTIEVNGQRVEKRHLVEFGNQDEELEIHAATDALILVCHAEPYGEPVVSYGPFVMNTKEEIQQAVRDYQAGKFGA
jgi:redox-sensitive bicupin YhaK (pirin superfamily)